MLPQGCCCCCCCCCCKNAAPTVHGQVQARVDGPPFDREFHLIERRRAGPFCVSTTGRRHGRICFGSSTHHHDLHFVALGRSSSSRLQGSRPESLRAERPAKFRSKNLPPIMSTVLSNCSPPGAGCCAARHDDNGGGPHRSHNLRTWATYDTKQALGSQGSPTPACLPSESI